MRKNDINALLYLELPPHLEYHPYLFRMLSFQQYLKEYQLLSDILQDSLNQKRPQCTIKQILQQEKVRSLKRLVQLDARALPDYPSYKNNTDTDK